LGLEHTHTVDIADYAAVFKNISLCVLECSCQSVCVFTRRRGLSWWSPQTPGCQWESDPKRTLLRPFPEDNTQSHAQCYSTTSNTDNSSTRTNLDKVHVHSVQLQPFTLVEEAGLCLGWILTPGETKPHAQSLTHIPCPLGGMSSIFLAVIQFRCTQQIRA
jgi:hypothetical protein